MRKKERRNSNTEIYDEIERKREREMRKKEREVGSRKFLMREKKAKTEF